MELCVATGEYINYENGVLRLKVDNVANIHFKKKPYSIGDYVTDDCPEHLLIGKIVSIDNGFLWVKTAYGVIQIYGENSSFLRPSNEKEIIWEKQNEYYVTNSLHYRFNITK